MIIYNLYEFLWDLNPDAIRIESNYLINPATTAISYDTEMLQKAL